MAKFLVTGGAGFIGSNTVEGLLNEGHEVRVLDNFVTGKKENLSRFLREIEVIEGDIRNLDVVRKAVEGMEYVVHLAGLSSVFRSVKDPLNTNTVMTPRSRKGKICYPSLDPLMQFLNWQASIIVGFLIKFMV